MSDFDAILFDFDGVLLDTEPLHFACWSEIFKSFNIQLDWCYFRKHYIGLQDRHMVDLICAAADPPADPEHVWPHYDQKKELFRQRLSTIPPISPSVNSLFSALGSYKLAVVTSSSRSEIEPILESAAILPLLGALVCGREAKRPKPAPDPYLLAAERLQATTALVVEDSDVGVQSGKAAGFEVLQVTSAELMPEQVLERLGMAPFS